MSNIQSLDIGVMTSPVTGNTSQWTAQNLMGLSGTPSTLNLTYRPRSTGPDYPAGLYTGVITATDSNGLQCNCTAPDNYMLTSPNYVLYFQSTITRPSNATSPVLSSPLTVTVTVTNIGGGGGGDPAA